MPVALSNCNLAKVCQYGGQAKGDGTQGCSCYAAPDCSSTEKCPLGLGGKPKADGTQTCNCTVKAEFTLNAAYTTVRHSDPTSDGGSMITDYYSGFCTLRKKGTVGSISPNTAFGKVITSFCQYESGEGGGDHISLCFQENLSYSKLRVSVSGYTTIFNKNTSGSGNCYIDYGNHLPSSGSVKVIIEPIK